MIVVKAIIRSDTGRVLIVKPDYKESWQLVGGTVEAGESPEQAAVREAQEELDLTLEEDAFSLTGAIYKQDGEIIFLVYKYQRSISENTPFFLQPDEIEGYEFIEPNDVVDRISPYYADFWSEIAPSLSAQP